MDDINIVKFPGLGLEFKIDRVAFSFFGIPVYWYGIIISAGFLLAIFLGLKNCKKFGIKSDDVLDLVFWAAPSAIIGARIYYILFNWHEFDGNIMKMINIREGGLAIYGGIIGGVLAGYIFTKVKKIDFLTVADLAGPYFIMAQGIGRWGNFVNQEAFGRNTNLPWGMHSKAIQEYLERLGDSNIDPLTPVHPAFLYESIWDLGVFLFLLWYRKRYKVKGELFFLYMMLYGVGRAWIEGLRTDSLYIGGTNIKASQLLAIAFAVIFAAVIFIRRRMCSGSTSAYNANAGTNVNAGEDTKVVTNSDAEVNENSDANAHIELNSDSNSEVEP
ncbi:MAG: prolipoprotein diacylglyceryl transferase [Clostridium sp.]|jgi:phosphatidylglycerol:prolipoprotein diacylglycerol transferase|nr:prolipoprotein diacylglyceryl transferase [Clostridium sp.]